MTFLRAWRRDRGWSQAQAAEALRIPRNVYAHFEVGRLRPSRLQLQKLTAYFGDEDLAQRMLEQVPAPVKRVSVPA
jgi:ribosome-binding protein aMBF1 (putative translation factor)